MTAILVDADACPVKEEVYSVAARTGVPVLLVANSRMRVPNGLDVEMIVVEGTPDAADDWIAENVRVREVVITADIPLAARCLEAGAYVMGPDGRPFTDDSIGGALASRDLNAHLREVGSMGGGPGGYGKKERSRFLSKLDELVQRSLREG